MTRWKLHRRCRVPGTGLAVVSMEQLEQFRVPIVSAGICRGRYVAAGSHYLVDRRRLQRDVRREAESIQSDINALGDMIPQSTKAGNDNG